MPRPASSKLANACKTLANSLRADVARANAEPTLYGRDKDLWAHELDILARNIVVTIGSLGLVQDPNGPRIKGTRAYVQAKEKWEFLTDKAWLE